MTDTYAKDAGPMKNEVKRDALEALIREIQSLQKCAKHADELCQDANRKGYVTQQIADQVQSIAVWAKTNLPVLIKRTKDQMPPVESARLLGSDN